MGFTIVLRQGKYLRFFILCKVFKNTRLGPLNPFYKRFKREQFQIDLLELRNISKDNKGTNLLLTIIDSYTKFAWAVPLRNKEKSTVLEAFKSVISKLDEKPLNIISDLGTISPFFLSFVPCKNGFQERERIIPASSSTAPFVITPRLRLRGDLSGFVEEKAGMIFQNINGNNFFNR